MIIPTKWFYCYDPVHNLIPSDALDDIIGCDYRLGCRWQSKCNKTFLVTLIGNFLNMGRAYYE